MSYNFSNASVINTLSHTTYSYNALRWYMGISGFLYLMLFFSVICCFSCAPADKKQKRRIKRPRQYELTNLFDEHLIKFYIYYVFMLVSTISMTPIIGNIFSIAMSCLLFTAIIMLLVHHKLFWKILKVILALILIVCLLKCTFLLLYLFYKPLAKHNLVKKWKVDLGIYSKNQIIAHCVILGSLVIHVLTFLLVYRKRWEMRVIDYKYQFLLQVKDILHDDLSNQYMNETFQLVRESDATKDKTEGITGSSTLKLSNKNQKKDRGKLFCWNCGEWETKFRQIALHLIKKVFYVHCSTIVSFVCIWVAVSDATPINSLFLMIGLTMLLIKIKYRDIASCVAVIFTCMKLLIINILKLHPFDKFYAKINKKCANDVSYTSLIDYIGLSREPKTTEYFLPHIALITVCVLEKMCTMYCINSNDRETSYVYQIFLPTHRFQVLKTLPDVFKYIVDFTFYCLGIEVTIGCLLIGVVHHSDMHCLVYVMWIFIIYFSSRSTQRRIWPIFCIYNWMSLFLQYLSIIGLAPHFCIQYPWTGRISNPLIRWLMLPHYGASSKALYLIADGIILIASFNQNFVFRMELKDAYIYYGGSNGLDKRRGTSRPFPIESFKMLGEFKNISFRYTYWVCLAVVMWTGISNENLYGIFYIIVSFLFFSKGYPFLALTRKKLVNRWNIIISCSILVLLAKACAQLLVCQFKLSCELQLIVGAKCPIGKNSSDCPSLRETIMGYDSFCLFFLILQARLFRTRYFQQIQVNVSVELELAKKGGEVLHQFLVQRRRIADLRERVEWTIMSIDAAESEYELELITMYQDHYAAMRSVGEYMFKAPPSLPDLHRWLYEIQNIPNAVTMPQRRMGKANTENLFTAQVPQLSPIGLVETYIYKGGREVLRLDELRSKVGSIYPTIRHDSDYTLNEKNKLGFIFFYTYIDAVIEIFNSISSDNLRVTWMLKKNRQEALKARIPDYEESPHSLMSKQKRIALEEKITSSLLLNRFIGMSSIRTNKFDVDYGQIHHCDPRLVESFETYKRDFAKKLVEGNIANVYEAIEMALDEIERKIAYGGFFSKSDIKIQSDVENVKPDMRTNSTRKEDKHYEKVNRDELLQMQLKLAQFTSCLVSPTYSRERDLFDLEENFSGVIGRLFYALISFGRVLETRSDYICYGAIIVQQIWMPSLPGVALAIFIFIWGMVIQPRPSKDFWVFMIFYIEIIILARFLTSYLYLFPTISVVIDKYSYYFSLLLGISSERKFIVEFLLLSLFYHQAVLFKYGYWSSRMTTPKEKRVIDEEQEENTTQISHHSHTSTLYTTQTKLLKDELRKSSPYFLRMIRLIRNQLQQPCVITSYDWYTIMFCCELLNLLLLTFGYSSFSGAETADVFTNFERNEIPKLFFYLIFLQFSCMFIDRVLYLKKSNKAKYIFQIIHLILVEYYVFIHLPRFGHTSITRSGVVKTFYLVKCLYFIASAAQLKSGYPKHVLGTIFRSSYGMTSYIIYAIYRAIPFMLELRYCMDWVLTPTGISLSHWIQIEDIFAQIFFNKCWRKTESQYTTRRGSKRIGFPKYIVGIPSVVAWLLIIWIPILFFSFTSVYYREATPSEAFVEISVGGEPLYRMEAANQHIHLIGFREYMNIRKCYSQQPSMLEILNRYKPSDIVRATFPPASTAIWSMSQDNIERFLNELREQDSYEFKLTYGAIRPHMKSTMRDQVNEFLKNSKIQILPKNDERRRMIREFLYRFNDTIKLPNLFPTIMNIHRNGIITPVYHSKMAYVNITARFTSILPEMYLPSIHRASSKKNNTKEYFEKVTNKPFLGWWHVTQDNSDDCLPKLPEHLTIYFLCDRRSPSEISFLTGYGIVGMYVSFVIVIGNIIRKYFAGIYSQIMFKELPDVDIILNLLKCIYLARETLSFRIEEALIARILFIYRSPETLFRLTRLRRQKHLAQIKGFQRNIDCHNHPYQLPYLMKQVFDEHEEAIRIQQRIERSTRNSSLHK
ncbi:hypothetical protein SNEBB_004392 [Seison nebaliae]|nr:hypothetical protein SNEBB_004392 [Seison nebaliae]